MSEYNKKIYMNVAALIGFVIFLAVDILLIRGAVPMWAFVATLIMAVVLIAVFSYRTMVWCAKLKEEV